MLGVSLNQRDRVDTESLAPKRRNPFGRLSMGHLAVALAAILAFVANVALLRSQDESVPVVVAARSIGPGQTIMVDDLTTTRINADSGLLSMLVSSTDGLVGRVSARSLAEGELVGASDLLETLTSSNLSSMAIPIDAARAAGGSIRVGDRVDVVDVVDGVATYVVRDAPVTAVSESGTGALSVGAESFLVVGLDSDQVLAVAQAIDDGRVDIVVTTGAGDG